MGRVSIYSDELAAEILDRMAGGEALNAICQDDNMPPIRTVRRWVVEDREGFRDALCARSRGSGRLLGMRNRYACR